MATRFPPDRESELVTFTQNFASKIATGYATYSLTQAQATTYGSLSSAFVTAYNVANAESTRTKVTLAAKNLAKDNLLANLRMLAAVVQAAPTTTNPMRAELGLPLRGLTPTPLGPPGQPYDFTYTLSRVQGFDQLNLQWKSKNPRGSSGTVYQVFRQVGANGPFVYLGGTGERKITDHSFPIGSGPVTYQVQGVRSTAAGAWGGVTVTLGAGEQTLATEPTAAVKIAA